ncbi:MAG TPA: universal stress protein [Candidatus Lumbricidophila sp.]|nr:universal stress protein [Candidatus Lumbricidophila sp.]
MSQPLHITVGLDDEPASLLAVDWAIREATRRPCRITLLSVFYLRLTDQINEEELLAQQRERVLQAAPGTTVETALAEGTIPETLKRHTAETDLLVIGAQRHHWWHSLMSGNIPTSVAVASSCPIVVVPGDWQPRDGDTVVGIDDDHSSDEALRVAADFAGRANRHLRVVHAWSLPTVPVHPLGLYDYEPSDETREAHRRWLDAAVERVAGDAPDLEVEGDLHNADAASVLLEAGASAELVVVGTHRRGLITAVMLGSVARYLLHHSKTPVCVVPPREA